MRQAHGNRRIVRILAGYGLKRLNGFLTHSTRLRMFVPGREVTGEVGEVLPQGVPERDDLGVIAHDVARNRASHTEMLLR